MPDPVATSRALFELVKKSNLFSPDEMERAYAVADLVRRASQDPGPGAPGLAPADDPRLLATQLARRGLLTAWQAQQLLAGRHGFFLGQYKLLELVASGRRGRLYKAEHVRMKRVVALKVVSAGLLAQPGVLARFQEQVRAAALVSHPNLVATYDGDCIHQLHFLVMEYVAGRHLGEWLKQCGPLPIDWSCECIRQTCLGLEHAHQRGVFHGELKPNHLLVVDEPGGGPPVVKILDLCLARLEEPPGAPGPRTRRAGQHADWDYLAPEQVGDPASADIRSDVFSAGCTLFELLTGGLPFGGPDPAQRLAARLGQHAPPLSAVRQGVPPALEAVVARMLAREPAGRYQTPGEAAESLAPFALVQARPGDEARLFDLPVPSAQLGRLEADTRTDSELALFLNQLASQTEERPMTQRAAGRR